MSTSTVHMSLALGDDPYLGGIYDSGSVNVNGTAVFNIYCYFSCFQESDFVVYKNGRILNTSADYRVSTYGVFHAFVFQYSSIAEKDTGIYEIRWLSQRLSWFVAINAQGKNSRLPKSTTHAFPHCQYLQQLSYQQLLQFRGSSAKNLRFLVNLKQQTQSRHSTGKETVYQ